MGLDADRWGTAVAAAIKTIGVEAGTKVTDSQLEDMWKAIKGEDVTEVSSNADINLSASDISSDVPALGILDSLSGPCSGQATGNSQAVLLAGKIE